MKTPAPVKELAALFGIAPSALRYWDEAGLIRFQRNQENHYRVPVFQTMMDISDVLFYRGLSLPVKDIRRLPAMDGVSLDTLLRENENALQKKMEALEASIEKIRNRQNLLNLALRLKNAPLTITSALLPAVHPFSFEDAQTVRSYAENQHQAVILLDPAAPASPQFGMITGEAGTLRPADASQRQYLYGLLRADTEVLENHDGPLFWEAARKLGHTPGMLLGRYLVSFCEERRYDYYEGWLELL